MAVVFSAFLCETEPLCAQVSEKVFRTDYRLDTLKTGSLSVDIDNISFFRNIESPKTIVPGYTLPGFWLQAKAVYHPAENVKLEAGVHSLWFWGADSYPAYAYSKLADWNDGRSSCAAHLSPYFRAQVALSPQVNIVLGNLYGGASHRLVEPLYNPELNLTADPETGVQLLYDTRWLHLDGWVNWETFIYNMDTKQEAFTAGISALFQANKPGSTWYVYFPLQALAQHRGGQIDDTDLPVQTMVNGALGAGIEHNTDGRLLQKLSLEIDMLASRQLAGDLWNFKRGSGIYVAASAELMNVRVKTAWWRSKDFIAMYGNPLFGVMSMSSQDTYFVNPKTLSFSGEYTRTVAKGCSLGIDFDFYVRLPGTVIDSFGSYPGSTTTMYTFGIYLRVNPSFLIKK